MMKKHIFYHLSHMEPHPCRGAAVRGGKTLLIVVAKRTR